MSNPYELSDDVPVYVISVAAHLSGMHPQTLRGYEKVGLVIPRRTPGGGRRYSMRDILTLREIQRLSQEGRINLEGIKRILDLERELEQTRLMAAGLHAEISQLRNELESTLVPVRSSTRVTFWQAAAAQAAPPQAAAAQTTPSQTDAPPSGPGQATAGERT
jgi:MerR family transcriptional regulator, heat shock protein HspR